MKRKEILIFSGFSLMLLLLFFICTFGGKIYGSLVDFVYQHAVFPDYLRSLFYETGDLFPDFMMNLGSGQNIYNIAYYGYLNPLLMLAYLFPFVSMVNYIICLMFIVALSSAILLYYYLRKNNFNILISTLVAFMLLCSTSLTFHMHRHIMFVMYMPFMILAMFGIDKYIEKKRSWLLILSLALILFISYYFSLSAFIILFLYGIYKYTKQNNFNVKWCGKFIIPFALGGFISAILVFPTLYVVLSSRTDSHLTYNFFELFFPYPEFVYDGYSPGLTLVSLGMLIFLLFKSDKIDKIFISIILAFTFIPFFNYALNGFVYVYGKVLIPFTPIILVIVATGFKKVLPEVLTRKNKLFVIYSFVSCAVVCIIGNVFDNLAIKEDFYYERDLLEQLSNEINDDSFYRINNNYSIGNNANYLANINEYRTTLYSSTTNIDYLNFYYKDMLNNYSTSHEFIINSSNNIFSQMYLNEKYIYSTLELGLGYKLIGKVDDVYLYENLNVLPLGYATSQLINESDYSNLSNAEKVINLIGSVITENNTTNQLSTQKKSYDELINSNIDFSKKNTFSKGIYNYSFKEDMTGKIAYVKFDVEHEEENSVNIYCNNQLNILSSNDYVYYNDNATFEYFISEPIDLELEFMIDSTISNLDIEVIDYQEVVNSIDINEFVVNTKDTKGDKIIGDIEVFNDSYFILSIPYDKGFTIKLNGQTIEYEKANNAFIGFNINQGVYEIQIEYKAPYKNISGIISITALILSIGYCVLEWRKDEKVISNSSLL